MFNARVQYVGAAESARIRAIGESEAGAMKRKAQAYKDYGKAAVTSLIMDALPKACFVDFHETIDDD